MSRLLLLSSVALVLLAAYYYGRLPSEPLVPQGFAAEQSDRIFLAKVESQATAQREEIEKAQADRPVPKAVAVAVAVPVEVRAAIAIRVPRRSASPATSQSHAQLSNVGKRLDFRNDTERVATSASEPEVRRAIPVNTHGSPMVVYR
jgi:hypothetical protein